MFIYQTSYPQFKYAVNMYVNWTVEIRAACWSTTFAYTSAQLQHIVGKPSIFYVLDFTLVTDSVSKASTARANGDPYCGPYVYSFTSLSWNQDGTVDSSVVRWDATNTFEVQGTANIQNGLYKVKFSVRLRDY